MTANGPTYGWCTTNQHESCIVSRESLKPCACDCHDGGATADAENVVEES